LDKNYATRCIKGLSLRPNKLELRLQALLDRIVPSEYKYTGDGSRIIAGKLPDFVNISGERKIIELFGRNWHDPEEAPERVARFKEYGWDCLVIWNDEFKDMEALEAKIVHFTAHEPNWMK
jgi:very-short-patch-repair endonuclease